MIRHAIHRFLRTLGYDVRRTRDLHFGLNWGDDLSFFKNPREVKTILDVGAHFGETAQAAIESFPEAKVYSFEPVPSSFEVLRQRVGNHPQVECLPMALGDAKGHVRMTARHQHSMNRILSDDEPDSAELGTVDVEIDTVDSFCAARGITHIDLLKIDTEGHDMYVLRGAERMLRGNVEFLLIECEFQPREGAVALGSFQEMIAFLTPLGFRVVALYAGRIDHLGWNYGDMLLKHVPADTPKRSASGSPWRGRSWTQASRKR